MPHSNPQHSLAAVANFFNRNFLLFLVAIIAFGVGFFGGSLWTENQLLKTSSQATARDTTSSQAQPQAQAPQKPNIGTAAVDDDPVLGQADAPITMIEFSDYECPFCKSFYDQTLPQIKEQYIDTGQVKLVYRDLPLSFHDPMATKEAVAANCARQQGGDEQYFRYHDEIFNRTVSNGNGLSDDDLDTIATDLGLNLSQFQTCLVDPTQEDEVKQDVVDAGQAGATGTPTFVIGVADEQGQVEGKLVVGAQPYAAFKAVIDPLLE